VVKPPHRTKSLGTKVSDGEYARLEALASTRGQTISELVRSVLLEEIAAPDGHGHAAAEQTLLAEVVGLRTILLNMFFKLANGERITAEEMQRLIERADADKLKKAQARLEQAASSGVKG
jgi:hypothetical protein